MIMAKFIIDDKQIKKINQNLIKRFDEFTSNSKELNAAGKIVVDEIKANSKRGKGYDDKNLPDIGDEWDARRKKLIKVNPKSEFYKSSRRSRVSFMGDTLKGIVYVIVGSKIEIKGEGQHRKIKGLKGGFLKGSDSDISDILSGLKKLGYKILGVSDRARDQIRRRFIEYIRRRLR
jgi:hypothetical protein